ncbi:Acetyltransferase component of pyruvate dehydrogenase complex [Mycena chlorophos]|uniref:Acetyltransferase component of pyruvate dehydrogenase complex n=1 Tax=Mycena chlorophos TaxID=658473 RepID=A0A8H6T3I9_MYCCL|nr:Acetyltransferase component of pyruvate dehydrogenase complex [Mycena chlorophos]
MDEPSERLIAAYRWDKEDKELRARLSRAEEEARTWKTAHDALKDENDALLAKFVTAQEEHDALAEENERLKALSEELTALFKRSLGTLEAGLRPRSQSRVPATPSKETYEANLATPVRSTQPPIQSSPTPSTSLSVFPKKEEPQDNDDVFLVPVVPRSPSPVPSYLTPLPFIRVEELGMFPTIAAPPERRPIFSRGGLQQSLGGAIQSLIVSIGVRKPLSSRHEISKFLVPNMSMNPWAPRKPGKHGYMFVGLGGDKGTFETAEKLELFVSEPPEGEASKESGRLKVSYMGTYMVKRAKDLLKDEWDTLAPRVSFLFL